MVGRLQPAQGKSEMTLRFALSKLLPIILRLWGVDTAVPQVRLDSSPDEIASAAARRTYAFGGVKVAVSRSRLTARE
jgi:hypothetical protein